MSSALDCVFEGFSPAGAEGANACLLVLGSFPSVRSQEKGEYYGHERNHFWPLLFSFTECAGKGVVTDDGSWGMQEVGAGKRAQSSIQRSYREKLELAARLGIVIWDMVHSCRRTNSSDLELEIIDLNDIVTFLEAHLSIERIGLNGGLSAALFLRTLGACEFAVRCAEERDSTMPESSVREARKLLSSTGGVVRLWVAGRERTVYRLPSTSPVPTRRFRAVDDKRTLWEAFLRADTASA